MPFPPLSDRQPEADTAKLRQEVDPAEVGLDPAALDRLDRFFARRVDDGLLPGYLVSVSRHGGVAHLTSYCLRDREAGLPVTADTVGRLYSMTKPVASVAALMVTASRARFLQASGKDTVRPGGHDLPDEIGCTTRGMSCRHSVRPRGPEGPRSVSG
ncbi:hypothetical protein C6Y14_13915 [Streptomyces dioscori]|uniref:Beta-lactamase-related domain-containing protein n=1 Tax=Streptomyces dioscori TaxID=2109333 RepID=A0A2P8QAI1_9ACTN|nr:hypothetical protein C6Y14_13915 [Streptomyces dioscori]